MAIIIDQLIAVELDYDFSFLHSQCASFVSENELASQAKTLKRSKKSMTLRGKKKPKETRYFFQNARALAKLAQQKAKELNDTVIAVLFRDTDGTASAGRGFWKDKVNSMHHGFSQEAFELGIPMIPQPKSEAWLLCAVKDNPYQHCHLLEETSGNDHSQKPLKQMLSDALNGRISSKTINTLLIEKKIDVTQINMNSFNKFSATLRQVVNKALVKAK